MPIPVIADHYLAQVVMKPDTLPTSNSFVNTFFFLDAVGGRSHSAVADDIEAVLENFYNTINAPGTITIAERLSGIIEPLLTTVRVYDLGEASPRIPEIRGMGSWTLGTTALPNEVAVVLSYRSGLVPSPTGGTIDKRERGRLFIGPLSTAAATYTVTDTDSKVADTLINALAGGATYLRDQTAEDVTWMQYSPTGNIMRAVLQGFVNNRFDTQRRRGADSTSRVVW
jgi:hypothetical protein